MLKLCKHIFHYSGHLLLREVANFLNILMADLDNFARNAQVGYEAFHSGIRLQQELAAARAMLTIHDEQIKSQRDRMNTLEDLIRQKEDKKAG